MKRALAFIVGLLGGVGLALLVASLCLRLYQSLSHGEGLGKMKGVAREVLKSKNTAPLEKQEQ